jgi:CheY-like chemotaxis protein
MYPDAPPLIAIVDDDRAFIELMEAALADEGYETIACADSEWAYDLIARSQPALVLLDIRMAYPTAGWDVLTLLRFDPTTAQLPVIICSADQFFIASHREQLHAAGCAILLKPFGLDDLLRTVRSLLDAPAAARSAGEPS